MPRYTYQCPKCHATQDVDAPFDKRPKTKKCLRCKGRARHILTPVVGRVAGVTFTQVADAIEHWGSNEAGPKVGTEARVDSDYNYVREEMDAGRFDTNPKED